MALGRHQIESCPTSKVAYLSPLSYKSVLKIPSDAEFQKEAIPRGPTSGKFDFEGKNQVWTFQSTFIYRPIAVARFFRSVRVIRPLPSCQLLTRFTLMKNPEITRYLTGRPIPFFFRLFGDRQGNPTSAWSPRCWGENALPSAASSSSGEDTKSLLD